MNSPLPMPGWRNESFKKILEISIKLFGKFFCGLCRSAVKKQQNFSQFKFRNTWGFIYHTTWMNCSAQPTRHQVWQIPVSTWTRTSVESYKYHHWDHRIFTQVASSGKLKCFNERKICNIHKLWSRKKGAKKMNESENQRNTMKNNRQLIMFLMVEK